MTHMMKTAATASLIALMSAAPLAASGVETGSPQQSVANDPDESVAKKPVTTDNSVVSGLETGSPAQSVDADPNEQVDYNSADGEGTIADELPTNSPALNDS